MRRDLIKLGRNTLIYGVGNVAIRLVSLLLLPVFTSYLTPVDYGISAILGVLTFFITPVFALGISGAIGVVYFERGDPARQSAVIWSAFGVLLVSAVVLVAVGSAFAAPLAEALFPDTRSRYDLGHLVALSLLTAGMNIATQPVLLYQQLSERAKTFVVITVSSAAVSIVLSVLFVVAFGRGVAGFIEAGAIAQALTMVAALGVGVARIPLRFDRELAIRLLRLGVPLIPTFVAVFVIQQANKWVLQDADGLSAVGIYTVGFNLGLFVTLIVGAFTTAWFPFFSSFMERPEDARRIVARVLSYYVLGVGGFSLLFFVWARPVSMVLTQPAFHGAYVSVGPSAAAQFLVGIHSVLLVGMYFAKDLRFQIVVQGAAAVFALGLNLILIPTLGVVGAAIALALGTLSMVLLQAVWNRWRRYLSVPYERGRLVAFAVGYTLIAGAFLADRDISLVTEGVISIAGSAIVIAGVAALLTSEERAQARGLLLTRKV